MPGRSALPLALSIALLSTGCWLWALHARAWGLGRDSPALGYDAAQYAVAARELAEHGRLATLFALPIELAWHAEPPWPLAALEPGLLAVEASLQRFAPGDRGSASRLALRLDTPRRHERLSLVFPLACYLLLGVVLSLVADRLLARHASQTSALERAAGAAVVGVAFLLDPEGQHLALGGSPQLPFTLGVVAVLALVASGWASRHAFGFGLLLGVTASFRASLPWLAPLLALAAVLAAPPRSTSSHRAASFALCLAGFALPLAPWWYYKWRAFGSPTWDLAGWALWDGVQGRTGFSIFHLPEPPALPAAARAPELLAAKLARNLPGLAGPLASGPGLFWIGSIAMWVAASRTSSALAIAATTLLALAALLLGTTALGIPRARDLFPARIPLEAAGLLAVWSLIGRLPPQTLGPRGARALRVAAALLALGWGGLQTARGNRQSSLAVAQGGSPGPAMLEELARRMSLELPADEPVMSNLGPSLAWYARRPVVHLALTPADIEACRQRLAFHHVVLAFRDAAHVWPGWREPFGRPQDAHAHPEWNVTHARHWQTRDGFRVVWLELGPPREQLARDQTRWVAMVVAPSARDAASTSACFTHSRAP